MIESLRWFGHASFLVLDEKVIYIDPWEIPKNQPKADLILITHAHFDHCSKDDAQNLAKPDAIVAGPPDCLHELEVEKNGLGVKPGDLISPLGFKIEVVPAYNLKPDRLNFHPKKNNWVGYILEVNGVRYYHAGDTDEIPEMKKIKTDVALLPVGGTYTMDPSEGAAAAKVIHPKVACPIHYGKVPGVGTDENAKQFASICERNGIKAQILSRYSG